MMITNNELSENLIKIIEYFKKEYLSLPENVIELTQLNRIKDKIYKNHNERTQQNVDLKIDEKDLYILREVIHYAKENPEQCEVEVRVLNEMFQYIDKIYQGTKD